MLVNCVLYRLMHIIYICLDCLILFAHEPIVFQKRYLGLFNDTPYNVHFLTSFIPATVLETLTT